MSDLPDRDPVEPIFGSGQSVMLSDDRRVKLFPPTNDDTVLIEFHRRGGDKEVITRVRISGEACDALGALIVARMRAKTEIALAAAAAGGITSTLTADQQDAQDETDAFKGAGDAMMVQQEDDYGHSRITRSPRGARQRPVRGSGQGTGRLPSCHGRQREQGQRGDTGRAANGPARSRSYAGRCAVRHRHLGCR